MPGKIWKKEGKNAVAIIFRDEEWGSKVVMAINKDMRTNNWQMNTITAASVGSWEPSYDTELWKKKKELNLFVQFTEQKDGEGKADIAPTPVQVLKIKLK